MSALNEGAVKDTLDIAIDLFKKLLGGQVYDYTKASAFEVLLTNTSKLKSQAIKSLEKANTKKKCLNIKKKFSAFGEYGNIERKYEGQENFKKFVDKGKEFFNWVEKTFIPMVDKKIKSLEK